MSDEIPLYSEIVPGLWQGGTDDYDTVNRASKLPIMSHRSEFNAVVTLEASTNPMGWLVKELRYGFPDGPIDAEIYEEIERIADWAFVEWKASGKTLIRCQAGLNRSGLLIALVLHRDRIPMEKIINLIREKRGEYALSNQHFVNYLLNKPKRK